MTDKPHGWDEFQQRQRVAVQPQDDAFDAACATGFSGGPGADLLAALRERYIERPENPLATEAELRVRSAHRQLIRELEAARDRGVAAIAKRSKGD